MLNVTTTTTTHARSSQRIRFKMYDTMMSIVLILNCCSSFILLPTAAAATQSSSASVVAASYLDVNVAENVADAAASTSAEILQLPHAFRHQEHYSHRIEQAVNDFKFAQEQQQQKSTENTSEQQMLRDKNKNNENNKGSNNNNNNWREYEQQHHRRHEQHQQHSKQQQEEQQSAKQEETFKSNLQQQQQQMQQHHLRHHNRHHTTWEQRVFPALRHQRHQQQNKFATTTTMRTTTATGNALDDDVDVEDFDVVDNGDGDEFGLPAHAATAALNVTHALESRYFDRDGLYSNPHLSAASSVWTTRTTRGPRSRHNYGNTYETVAKSGTARFAKHTERAYGDEASRMHLSEGGDSERSMNHLSGKRFSLKLTPEKYETDDDVAAKHKNTFPKIHDDIDIDADDDDDLDNDDDDDDDDDYSYEDTAEPSPVANEFPVRTARVAKQQFSNPFKSYRTSRAKHFETAYDDGSEYETNNSNNDKHKNKNYDDDDNDNDSDDYDAAADTSEDINSDIDFSSEKWHRIEQTHHLKQQQHQRELQRQLHNQQHDTGNGGRSMSSSNNGKYSTSAASVAAKRQAKNNNDAENIFSRNYIPGTLTRQKQEELGTLEAVRESRRQHVAKHMQNKALANAHAKQIFSEASCRIPQRRIERIQRDPTKIYTPHCTVLHRCADDTGCCKSDRQTCAPKRTKSVDLYFFVKSINDKKGAIERLTFINHTECHCVEKAKHQPAEYGGTALYASVGNNALQGQILRHATILNCNCPKLYEKILQEDGYCRCDCSSGNTGCDWLKRGMEHFSMNDRKCIIEGRCKPPTCEYGTYLKKHGRCPRREEQLSAALGSSTILTTNAIKSRSYQ